MKMFPSARQRLALPKVLAWRALLGDALRNCICWRLLRGSPTSLPSADDDAKKPALVSSGAGLIGSHIADLLARESWRLPIFDNLEPNMHKGGRPAWINPAAEFVQRNLRHLPIKKGNIPGSQAVYSEILRKNGIVHRVRIS